MFENSLGGKPNIFYLALQVGTTKSANDVEAFTGAVDIGDLKGCFLVDSIGTNSLKFNSPMDIFNQQHEQGWEFVGTVQDTLTTALWGKLFFDVMTVRTDVT